MSDTIIKFVNWNDVALNIQNGMLFLLSVSSLFSCLYYNINSYYSSDYALDIKNVSRPFDLLMPFVTIHAFTDLFLTKSTDLKIHHFSVLGVLFYNYYYNVSETDRFPIIYSLLKTEISSIFYVLKYWLPKNTLAYDINSALFYLGFLKFRIIDLYFDLVNNSLVFDLESKKFGRLRTSDVPTVNTLGISGALTPVTLSCVFPTCGISTTPSPSGLRVITAGTWVRVTNPSPCFDRQDH
jgi:hypothetical protein